MHRQTRCRLTASMALATLFLPALPQIASAQAKPASRLATRMRLGDGVNTWQPTRKQIGVSYASGSDSSPYGAFKFAVNRAKLRAYLTKTAKYIKRDPKDAKVIVADPQADDMGEQQVPAKIVPGYDGAALNVDAAVDAIEKQIVSNPADTHVVLPLKTQPAHVSAADLQGIDARIGYFITRFNPGDEGRTSTVRRAIDTIDGNVVSPGGVFSVDRTVGPRDPAHGYNGKAHVFVNGHIEMQSGGGMCQVATTLFNAAMLADLKIVERHQHVRTVPYVDPGRDATIYHGQKDFRFQNDTGAPLYISYKTTHSRAVVSLYGKGTPGQKVKLISHHRRLGERHYTGTFYAVAYKPDGTKEKSKVFSSNYNWPPTLDYSR